MTYSHRVMTETDKILASLPKVIHTAYRNKKTGVMIRSDVYLVADFSRPDVWLMYATKTGSYMLTLVIAQSFSDAVKLMAERVKELMLTETDIFIDEKR